MSVEKGDSAPDCELKNHEGRDVRLSQRWNQNALLLVFLRHLGCPLCFDHVARIRQEYETLKQAGVIALTVTMGNAAQAADFKSSQRLPCEVLADPEQRAYQAYGLPKGGALQIAGPQMWWAGFRSIVRFGARKPVGDVWQMPGAFLIEKGGKVLYAHRAAHSGDLESYDQILRIYQDAQTQTPLPHAIAT
jgi:peroxiredoxin